MLPVPEAVPGEHFARRRAAACVLLRALLCLIHGELLAVEMRCVLLLLSAMSNGDTRVLADQAGRRQRT